MVQKIVVCDMCKSSDSLDYDINIIKCSLCKKDICSDCTYRFMILIGKEDEEISLFGGEGLMVCEECLNRTELSVKKDKMFLNKIQADIIEYLNQKIMLGELEK